MGLALLFVVSKWQREVTGRVKGLLAQLLEATVKRSPAR